MMGGGEGGDEGRKGLGRGGWGRGVGVLEVKGE